VTMAETICIDGLMLSRRFVGTGINRYLVNLLRQVGRIAAGENHWGLRILVPSLSEFEDSSWTRARCFELVPCPAMRFHRAWKYGLVNSVIAGMNSEALFIPLPVSVYFKPKRLAITIHDVIPLLFPERHRSMVGKVFLHTYLSSMHKADLILTDSEHSKTDMASRFGVPADKIVVTYLGFDSDLFKPDSIDASESRELLKRYKINRPYVLHVGRGDPRKNLATLVRAYQLLISRRTDLDFQLVLSGPLGWGYESLLRLLKEPAFQGRGILTGAVSDAELAVLYRHAACFAMPSLYEGFGLPVLEAMASGVPAISSNRSSLPEVAGDAALYFDPESVEEMTVAMERILTDSTLRERLIKKGLDRAKQFSWEACARTTLTALKDL